MTRRSRRIERGNNEQEGIDVLCAFCGGKGKDPFGLLSPLSTCQVCGGRGRRRLRQPTAPCPFCQSTGVHLSYRLTCLACDGVGTVEVPADATPCRFCSGSGRADKSLSPDGPTFTCVHCGGKGIMVLRGTKT